MSWHRFFTIEASFECAPISGGSTKGGRSRRTYEDVPDPDEVARQFIAKVGKPRFGKFEVRDSKYTAVRPGLELIRVLIRKEIGPRSAPASPRRSSRRRRSTRASGS
jgi:hypothetical protein